MQEAMNRYIKHPHFSDELAAVVREPREEDAPEQHPALQALTRLAEPTVTVCVPGGDSGTATAALQWPSAQSQAQATACGCGGTTATLGDSFRQTGRATAEGSTAASTLE